MRINNYFNKNEDITMVIPGSVKITTIQAFKYILGKELESIDISIKELQHNIVTINNITDDCYIIFKYGKDVDFIKVGNHPPVIFIRTNKTDLTYNQYDFNNNLLSTGQAVNILDNIHAILVVKDVKSFITVIGSIITLTNSSRLANKTVLSKGSIELERGVWQLISIPLFGKVKDIFLDSLAKQTNQDISNLIEVVSAYPGHVNKFLTYIPNISDINSIHNFDCMINDNGSLEITSFWVKCKEWEHTKNNIVFSWSEV